MPWDVNYVIFGVMYKLCGLSKSLMEYVIKVWKLVYGEMDVHIATAWAVAGYSGWPSVSAPDTTLTANCPNNCSIAPLGPCSAVAANRGVFQVVWKPGDPPFYIGCFHK